MERVTKFYSAVTALFALCMISNLHSMLKNQAEEIRHRSKRELEDDFIEEALKQHNEYRERHGSPPLTLNKSLCVGIDDWAKKQSEDSVAAGKISMTHSHTAGIGENLGVCKCKKWAGARITKAWYDEIRFYNWSDNTFNAKTGHFTQLIWKDAKTFCIARHTAGEYGSAVARYYPRGNADYRSAFAANVLPPRDLDTSSTQSTSDITSTPSTSHVTPPASEVTSSTPSTSHVTPPASEVTSSAHPNTPSASEVTSPTPQNTPSASEVTSTPSNSEITSTKAFINHS